MTQYVFIPMVSVMHELRMLGVFSTKKLATEALTKELHRIYEDPKAHNITITHTVDRVEVDWAWRLHWGSNGY